MSAIQTLVRDTEADVADFQNPDIVARISNVLNLEVERAQLLFEDVKRFLKLCSVTDRDMEATNIIDDGWHEFLLFSKEYQDFCAEYLGGFVHHRPWIQITDRCTAETIDADTTRRMAEERFGPLSENWR
ncbi:MAG: hypothetical protein EOP09_12125 [Proteobacteria bacterium]|nr:MAG: hypothetical protein EOP09_12125 [Pseudomonadota bacterium]